ncbi:hypothetical protein HDV00_002499 [Rhizophlyctis rosea]|nr:hypothetical protein HDV00_002499 [Rhizophlyctis rosea]
MTRIGPLPQTQPQAGGKRQLKPLKDLTFTNNFIYELPCDPLTPLTAKPQPPPIPVQNPASTQQPIDAVPVDPSRTSRTVRGACYSVVQPDTSPNPTLLGFSPSSSQLLDLDPDEHTTPSFTNQFTGITPFPASPATSYNPIPLPHNPNWSHAYGGHQYGFYAGQLGDGRCISLFQLHNSKSEPWEAQLKSTGPTPYSRFGDGRSTLRSAIREFLACEYMAALGVPTIRALAVWGTARIVYRERNEPEGLLVRLAPSWVRFGSFELFHYRSEREGVKLLADYIIRHHFPECIDPVSEDSTSEDHISPLRPTSTTSSSANRHATGGRRMSIFSRVQQQEADSPTGSPHPPRRTGSAHARKEKRINEETGAIVEIEMNQYARFFQEVCRRTAHLVAWWQSVGFVHGSLNTDDMSVLGLTLDYGPFGFLESYNPFHTSNTADHNGRYRFEHQPRVVIWNLSKMGRTLAHLLVSDKDADEATSGIENDSHGQKRGPQPMVNGGDVVKELLREFEPAFIEKYTELMRKKLGLRTTIETDLQDLILPLLQLMADVGVDYTPFFRSLCHFRCSPTQFASQTTFDPAKYEASKDPSLPAPKPRLTDPLSLLICAGLGLIRRARAGIKERAKWEGGGESNLESSLAGAYGKVDAAPLVSRDMDEHRPPSPPLSEADVPTLLEIASAWAEWAEKYRQRILSEISTTSTTNPSSSALAATPSKPSTSPQQAQNLDLEDIRRLSAMQKSNPRYTLRPSILSEIIRGVEAEMGATKKGPLANVQRGHGDEGGGGGGGGAAVGSKTLERAMRVLIRDVWGEQAESSTGWKDEEDKKCSDRWGGLPAS